MIRLDRVSYTYADAPRPALEGIDISVREGEWVLLAGPSGCGKSTLMHLLNGLIPHVLGGRLHGTVSVNGLVPEQSSVQELSRRVGTVFQNPELQLFMLRVEEDVAFGCENLGMPPEQTRQRTDWALDRLALTAIRTQEVSTLSGGQKQRLAIAGALAMGAKTLLLDEPTSDLDQDSRRELLVTLRELHRQGHTILMTEHRFDGLDGLVDRVVTLDRGNVVANGSFPIVNRVERYHTTCDRNVATPGTEVLVDVDELELGYVGCDPVLRDATCRVNAGEVVALTGCNGCGKTTLLKTLCGLLRPTKGRLCVAGIERPSLSNLIGTVGFLFQNPDEQIFTDCVADEILFGPRNRRHDVNLDAYLNTTGLAAYRDAHPRCLSRGERQRLVAAAVLAMRPKVLLLDEPTTGLDQAAWTALMRLIVDESRRNEGCVLFSTHHREAAEAFADRILTIADGTLVDERLS